MLNVVTAFDCKVPHMGQLLHEAVHVIDGIRARSPVGNTICPLQYAVFRYESTGDVICFVGQEDRPVLGLVFRFDSADVAWKLARPLETYMDDYAEEILRVRANTQIN